jgi:Sigma-70 region 2
MIRSPDRPDAPDDAAVLQASKHAPEEFTEIFHRYFAEIHRYVARRLGADAADDIAAETFLIAFRKRERFDPARGAVRPGAGTTISSDDTASRGDFTETTHRTDQIQ